MQFAQTALLFALCAPALAAPQNGEGCIRKEYIDITNEGPYDSPAYLVTGHGCISDNVNTCTVTNQATFIKTMSWTIGGNVGGSMDFAKIWKAVSQMTWTIGFAESDAEGISTTVTCPSGLLNCGLQATAKVLKIKGTKVTYKKMFSNNAGTCSGQETEISREPWEVETTVTEGEGKHNAVINFRACFQECADGADCQGKVDEAGIPNCP